MNFTLAFAGHRRLLAAVAVGVASMAIGAVAIVQAQSGGPDKPPPLPVSDESQVEPRPVGAFQFWNPQVGFYVHDWDDRQLSDEDKAKDPIFNPAWPHFESCMVGAGVQVRALIQGPLSQADLSGFLKELNSANPDPTANFDLLQLSPSQRAASTVPGSPGARAVSFLNCASEWLTKTPKEVFEATGVPNEYFPPK